MSLQDGAERRFWEPGPRVRAAFGRALDLVFPPAALDGTAAPQSTGLSAQAWTRVQFIAEPLCDGCGAPFEYDVGERCAACMAKPRAFSRARAACLYDDASPDLILKFKHADRTDLARLFSRWVGRAAADLLAEADAVAPVPLHATRMLARRYNQAAEIARPLARTHRLAYLPDALVRARRTQTQGGKSGSGRRRNVAGAFEVPAARRARVKGRHILLIDDVMTTGATAEGCARALLAAGARRVDLAVIARVREAANISI
ncbi:MAG TPA: ComF family protein [Caulobacteraceae bacterium]|jgi:ComF family protein|nr:ComF family protein [Caulobacteraceae bacterium]